MNMIVCEVGQPPGVSLVLVYLVVAGGSLVIEIRGRLISQWHCTRRYVAVVGGSLVMWDTFLHPAVLGRSPLLALRLSGADQCLIWCHIGLG